MSSENDDHADLLGLLTGEATARERSAALEHLRSCPTCPQTFLDTALTIGLLRDAARHAPVDPSEVPRLRLDLPYETIPSARVPEPRARRPRRLVAPALVGLALVAALVGGIAIGRSGRPAPVAGVTLTAVGLPDAAHGQAHMLGTGQAQQMNITVTGLKAPVKADHFEVWLLDTATGRVQPVGTISGSSTTFSLPASRTVGFNAIDISLQMPSDGSKHSGHSVLRGTIA